MARTTPPRPVDVLAHFPELTPHARTTVRLHPRAGAPTTGDSSIGGPLLWPADEPWPTCPDHSGPWQRGVVPDDVRLRRRILDEAWSRPRADGADLLTAEERVIVDRAEKRRRVPQENDEALMVPVAQLYARDVPGLPRPNGRDVLQVLWCAADHAGDYLPRTVLRWRTATDVTERLAATPQPSVIGKGNFLPEPCVLHPEQVTEYPAPHELPEELADRIEAWEDSQGVVYQYDLAVAPGCKVAGHAPWSFTDPFPMACAECGSDVMPLLYVKGSEWDGGSLSWRPVEDVDRTGPGLRRPGNATQLTIGRGNGMQIYLCTASYDHPHLQNLQ
ncbi:hypothetical protein ACIGPN_08910 [Streptomyces afghaniensis]|uniref:hypothetical protein n=1 Tax=Streptomyces afghaniensis TaxID=66865 RepID=UPI0037CCDE1C